MLIIGKTLQKTAIGITIGAMYVLVSQFVVTFKSRARLSLFEAWVISKDKKTKSLKLALMDLELKK